MKSTDIAFPTGSPDEAELLVQFLDYVRGAVLRNVEGITDEDAHWTPDGRLTSLVGLLNHLATMEWRWMDGGFAGAEVRQPDGEYAPDDEFAPDLALDDAVLAYRARGEKTDAMIRAIPLTTVGTGWAKGHDLRFVALHILDETARHAGHADAVRELIDGATGI